MRIKRGYAFLLALAFAAVAIAATFGPFKLLNVSWYTDANNYYAAANWHFFNSWQYNVRNNQSLQDGSRLRVQYADAIIEFRVNGYGSTCAGSPVQCYWYFPTQVLQAAKIVQLGDAGGYDAPGGVPGTYVYVPTGFWMQQTDIVNGYVTITAYWNPTGYATVYIPLGGSDGFRRPVIY